MGHLADRFGILVAADPEERMLDEQGHALVPESDPQPAGPAAQTEVGLPAREQREQDRQDDQTDRQRLLAVAGAGQTARPASKPSNPPREWVKTSACPNRTSKAVQNTRPINRPGSTIWYKHTIIDMISIRHISLGSWNNPVLPSRRSTTGSGRL